LASKSGATTSTAAPLQAAQPAVAVQTPVTNDTNTGGLTTAKLEEILLTVISEKTGYPTEMLELDMDMEADLGIDSIKRVEIFGAMTEDYPEVSGVNPQDLTDLRTLGQIVDYLAEKAGKKKILA
jgi:acyl carrier protein